ncbi:MAG: hypothetical protein COB60_01045 [Flavobacteriaceae bacterium]|nr:MAG: hypothetical protein COB60_01045 [Flavobacteriaceae bacterium]
MKKILLIDDQIDNLITLKAILKLSSSEYQIFTATTGKLGIKVAEKELPDVIFLDIIMPEMDGYEVCSYLKSQELTSDIPIVMITALKTDCNSHVKGLETGADLFLTKPIEPLELIAQLKVVFRIKETEDKLKAQKNNLNELVKQRTEELSESEHKYRSIVENTNEGIFIVQNGLLKFSNPYTSKLTGYEKNELVDAPFTICIADDDKDEFIKSYKNRLKGVEVENALYLKLCCKDGSLKYVCLSAEQIMWNKEEALLYIITDLTVYKEHELELIKAKEQAEKSEEYLHSIINNMGDPIFVKDEQSRLLLVNDAFCKIFNLNRIDIIGKTLMEEVPQEEQDLFLKIDKQVLSDGIESISEELLTVGENPTLTISTRKTRFIDNKGTKFLIGAIRDISKRKEAEVELKKAKERAEESDRLKSAFLANMSHEIRTPMNGILGFSSLLKEPNLTGEKQLRYIDIIEKSGVRMLNIINNIIDISKVEAGLMQIDLKETNINKQIEYVFTFFKNEALSKNLELNLHELLPNEEVIVNTDREKLYAILINLVKNAIKYTNKGAIEVGYRKTTTDPIELEFFVKDTGIGISKNRMKAIFERFIQADIEDRDAIQGAGLGLAISKAYVEMLGGRIWVVSEYRKGSTFYFTIPYNPIKEKRIVVNNNFNTVAYTLNGLKVLIVDDDNYSRVLLLKYLEGITSEILTAQNGNEAIEISRNNLDLDLILMDIRMPIMNGIEAVRQIRAFNKEVYILAQTSNVISGDREKALEVGCNNYISKPINKNELITIINSISEKSPIG